MLERTNLELNGIMCLSLDDVAPKQQIIVSRSFSQKISHYQELSQAIFGHVATAAVKLRQQHSECRHLSVFAKTSAFNPNQPYASLTGQYQFITPTHDTRTLIQAARQVLEKIYQQKLAYAKAGVMLSGISPIGQHTVDLFETPDPEQQAKSDKLMAVMNNINRDIAQPQSKLFIASTGIQSQQTWQMRRDFLSPCYTTKLDDVLRVE